MACLRSDFPLIDAFVRREFFAGALRRLTFWLLPLEGGVSSFGAGD
jgi:hypothetical protein